MRNVRRFIIKPFVLTIGFIGFGVSIVALVDLIMHGISYAVADWLNDLLNEYRKYSELAWKPLEPLAEYLIQHLNRFLARIGLEISLNPWWKSFWTPLFFYAVAVARAAWIQYRARDLQLVYLCVGFPVFFASSVAASNWTLVSDSVWPMVIIGAGFAVLHLFGVLWQARFRSNPNAPPEALLRFVIAYPLANLGIVLVIAMASVLLLSPKGIPLPVVAQVLFAVALMGARDVAAGLYGATFIRSADESWWRAFFGYATTAHGLYVLAALAAAAVTVIVAVRLAAHILQ